MEGQAQTSAVTTNNAVKDSKPDPQKTINDLAQEVRRLKKLNQGLETAKADLQVRLDEYEKPVPGQVSSEAFVGAQARARIRAAASRGENIRKLHTERIRIVAINEGAQRSENQRSAEKQVRFCPICPDSAPLLSPSDVLNHNKSIRHKNWVEREEQAKLKSIKKAKKN